MAVTKTLTPFPPRTFLARHRQDELDALFATLPAPRKNELQGNYQGTLLGISGLSSLPGVIKSGLYRLLASWLNPWQGKHFNAPNGANLWGLGTLQGAWGHYRIENRQDSDALVLDYDVEGNPALLRPILGEVRCFQGALYLARMCYRTRSGTRTLLYFTLQEVR